MDSKQHRSNYEVVYKPKMKQSNKIVPANVGESRKQLSDNFRDEPSDKANAYWNKPDHHSPIKASKYESQRFSDKLLTNTRKQWNKRSNQNYQSTISREQVSHKNGVVATAGATNAFYSRKMSTGSTHKPENKLKSSMSSFELSSKYTTKPPNNNTVRHKPQKFDQAAQHLHHTRQKDVLRRSRRNRNEDTKQKTQVNTSNRKTDDDMGECFISTDLKSCSIPPVVATLTKPF